MRKMSWLFLPCMTVVILRIKCSTSCCMSAMRALTASSQADETEGEGGGEDEVDEVEAARGPSEEACLTLRIPAANSA